jgi:hypothetical protein
LSLTTSSKEETAMGSYMTGSQFGVKVGWRVGIFLALTIGFPFIVYGLIVATGARGVGGASGALAVVAGTFLKPVIILGFVISLLSPCWQRMRSLGFPGFVGLLAPFLFLMDWPYFLAIGAHWGVAFSFGILILNPPLFAMSALAMLIAMGVASPPDNRSPSQRAVGRIGGILAIVLFVIALVSTFPMLWVMGRIWLTSAGGKPAPFVLSATLFYWAFVIKPFVCAAFCMAMAAMAYLSRKESSGHSPGDSEPGGGPPVRSPPNTGAVVFGRR